MAALKPVLASMVLVLQTAQLAASASAATFEDVYGWIYRTGTEVKMNAPAAQCLGLKTPQSVYERTWLAPDAKVHAMEVGADTNNPFMLLAVRHNLSGDYFGAYFLSDEDGRLLGVCNSPFVNASFVAVKDGSLDVNFESEKAYFLQKFGQRGKWDRYAPEKRNYP